MTDEAPVDVGLLDAATVPAAAAALVGDQAVVAAMVDVEIALVGALSAGAVDASALRSAVPPAAQLAAEAGGGGNPVIPLLARLRAAADGPAAELLHRGATSQDVLDSALMLVAHRSRRAAAADLRRVATALAELADTHRRTPAVARTLGQHAAPTVFGLRAAVLLDGVVRTADQLRGLPLPAQLGGSVGTLAVLVDRYGEERTGAIRAALAERLGLAAPAGVWHVERSATGGLAAALAALVGALGRVGLEIVEGSRAEIGELAVDAGEGRGGSSAMPQKRNPVAAVLLVSNARRAPSLAATVLGGQLAVDDRAPGDWHAEWQPLRELLRLAVESSSLAADALAALSVRPDRMRANLALGGGAVHTERLTAVLQEALGRDRAAAVVRDALGADDVVAAVLAAVEGEAGLADRVRAVTGLDGPVGLSDRLIDAALERARGWTA